MLDGLLYVRAGLIGVFVSPRQHDVLAETDPAAHLLGVEDMHVARKVPPDKDNLRCKSRKG